jgi:hypothetical protein
MRNKRIRLFGDGAWVFAVALMLAALPMASQGCGVPVAAGDADSSLVSGTTANPVSVTAPEPAMPSTLTIGESETADLFPIEVGNRWGYINRKGTIAIEPQFAYVEEFSEGLAAVDSDGDGFYDGYIGASGEIVLKPAYNYLDSFSEGLAMVDQDGPEGVQGYIDKTGATVVEPAYIYARNFREGLAAVKKDDSGWGYIDKTGQFVIKPKYRSAGDFSEGLAWVETFHG